MDMGKESRKKGRRSFVEAISSLAVCVCVEYGFAELVLVRIVSRDEFWTVMILGAGFIAVINVMFAYLLNNKAGTKSGRIGELLISTVLLSTAYFFVLDGMPGDTHDMILLGQEDEYVWYYTMVCSLAFIVDGWTIVGYIVYKAVRFIKSRRSKGRD